MRIATGALIGLLMGAGVLIIGDSTRPKCPTEDSCTVDYRSGEWHVTEVTP